MGFLVSRYLKKSSAPASDESGRTVCMCVCVCVCVCVCKMGFIEGGAVTSTAGTARVSSAG